MKQPFDCFLSHSSVDKPFVIRLKDELTQRGVKVWLDQDEILAGDLFVDALERGIEQSRTFILVVSPDSIKSGWVKEEYARAVSLTHSETKPLRLIPVLYRDAAKPGFLSTRHHVDFRVESDFDAKVKILIDAINGIRSRDNRSDSSPETQLLMARNHLKRLIVDNKPLSEIELAKRSIVEARQAVREGNRLRPGDVLNDRYELIECVGSGGFATVWKCFDEETMSVVAAKVLHPSHRDEQSKIERFFRGSRLMKQLEHENIVKVLEEKCSDEYFHFYVMEFIDGGDFHQAVIEGRLSEAEVMDVILSAGKALDFAHATLPDLVHRDVKPSNLLLTSDKQAKVTDFDLVRMADTTGGTRTGSLGTWIYAAPESMERASQVDQRADIFSLGMTALFGLFGKDLPVQALRSTSEFIDELSCSQSIKTVLNVAVDWDLDRRYDAMNSFVTNLQAALETGEASVGENNPRTERTLTEKGKSVSQNPSSMVDKQTGIEFVRIPAGKFLMGDEAWGNTKPVHPVEISRDFYLAKFPVTNEEYGQFLTATGHDSPEYWDNQLFNSPGQPVVGVSWDDAIAFCEWGGFVLPTEAQWEYACRAGSEGSYCFGDDITSLQENAWFNENSNGKAQAVGRKKPNSYGLFDMHGNVWEWCADFYGPYNFENKKDPSGPGIGSYRVVRGGSWKNSAWYVRSACRGRDEPSVRGASVGFRCLIQVPNKQVD